jgi:hypothetical protein
VREALPSKNSDRSRIKEDSHVKVVRSKVTGTYAKRDVVKKATSRVRTSKSGAMKTVRG